MSVFACARARACVYALAHSGARAGARVRVGMCLCVREGTCACVGAHVWGRMRVSLRGRARACAGVRAGVRTWVCALCMYDLPYLSI